MFYVRGSVICRGSVIVLFTNSCSVWWSCLSCLIEVDFFEVGDEGTIDSLIIFF